MGQTGGTEESPSLPKQLCLTFIVLANKSGCERAVFHVQLHSPGRKEANYVQDVKILADTCMILLHLLQHMINENAASHIPTYSTCKDIHIPG